MKMKYLFAALFAVAAGTNKNALKIRGFHTMNLAAPVRYDERPKIGWRKVQSVSRHREIQRRQRRNAQ